MDKYKFGSVHQTQLGSLDGKHLAVIKPARGYKPTQVAFILRLPTEVLFEIFQYVVFHIFEGFCYELGSAPDDLYTAAKRLSLVCRRFNSIVLPLFYHDIYVKVRGQSNLSLRKLHAVLQEKSWTRDYCKRLDLSLAHDGPLTKDSISMVTNIVSYLTNVRTFEIACGPKQLPHDTVEIIRTATQHMRRIENLIFNHHCHTFFSQEILKHISFPSLQDLEIEGIFAWGRPAGLRNANKPEPKMYRTGTFTSLAITYFEENAEALKQLIQWPASLVHFQLLDWWGPDYIDLPILGAWLSMHKNTLKTIEIGNLPHEGRGVFFDLSKFAKLEVLMLSWPQMGGWLPEDEEEEEEELEFFEEDADSLLAPNLHTFVVQFGTGDEGTECWHYFGKVEEHWIREFAKFAIARKAALRKIQISFNRSPQSFKKEYGYPWDRMDRIHNEIQPHGLGIEYNEACFTKEEWMEYVQRPPPEEDLWSSSMRENGIYHYFPSTSLISQT